LEREKFSSLDSADSAPTQTPTALLPYHESERLTYAC
jgi:hypothetical protein